MTPITEAELLRMREVQARATPGPLRLHPGDTLSEVFIRDDDNRQFILRARTDWPRLTEWALEARRLLEHATAMLAEFHPPTKDGCVVDETLAEARRLLGE